MGFFRGPNIVSDGLLYALDASSPLSYQDGAVWYNIAPIGQANTATLSGTIDTQLTNEPKYLETDGVDGEVFIPGGTDSNLNFDNTDSFSIEAWCNLQAMPSSGNTTAVVAKAYKCGIDIYYPTVSTMVFRVGVRGSSAQSIISQTSTNIELDVWNCVTFTYTPSSATGVKLYINGSFNNSGTNSGQDDFSNNTNYTIGGNEALAGTPKFSNLRIAAVKFYNKTLSNSEVFQNYSALKERFV
tara:strand:- start:314 stop:1039 length:726 start_codon:yes stop_codon:yes gene_type:complete